MAAPIIAQTTSFLGVRPSARRQQRSIVGRSSLKVRAGPYDEELVSTAVSHKTGLRIYVGLLVCLRQKIAVVVLCIVVPSQCVLSLVQGKIATKGRGILAMDESNATCGKRLDSIGLENTEDNRRTYRELLLSTPGLGDYISGAILFEETLYQSDRSGTTFVDLLHKQNIVPGASVGCSRQIDLCKADLADGGESQGESVAISVDYAV